MKKRMRQLFVLAACCLVLAGGRLAWADEDEAEGLGIQRSLNIEEALQESAVYEFISVDNDFSAGHSLLFSTEATLAFNPQWGLEFDFPQILAVQPLGQGQSALGPIGLGLKYVPWQAGKADSAWAGVSAVEAFGQAWPSPNSIFSGTGNAAVAEALEAFRFGKIILQGQYGYTWGLANSGVLNTWFANTSLGALAGPVVPQVEVDFASNAAQPDGSLGPQWSLVPELGFKADEWFAELGEQWVAGQSGSTTLVVIERDF